MFMTSQQFCQNAPPFKLPKQFEQMKNKFKVELSISKDFSTSKAMSPTINQDLIQTNLFDMDQINNEYQINDLRDKKK